MSTVWITGTSGYLGRAFIREWKKMLPEIEAVLLLRKKPESSEGFKISLPSDPEAEFTLVDLESLAQTNPPEGIIHFATHFMNAYTPSDAEKMLEANVGFPIKMLESCRKIKSLWFLNFGSFYSHADGTADGPMTYYAATKRSLETFLNFYAESHAWRATTLKIFDTYGPNDTRLKLVPKLFEVLKSGAQLDLSPGEQKLSLVHVDDVVRASYRAIELLQDAKSKAEPAGHSVYQLPADAYSSHLPSLRQVVATLEEAAGRKMNIKFGALPYRPREIMNPNLDFPVLPGWKPKINLLEGFRSMLA